MTFAPSTQRAGKRNVSGSESRNALDCLSMSLAAHCRTQVTGSRVYTTDGMTWDTGSVLAVQWPGHQVLSGCIDFQ